jgi:hypothetical protein
LTGGFDDYFDSRHQFGFIVDVNFENIIVVDMDVFGVDVSGVQDHDMPPSFARVRMARMWIDFAGHRRVSTIGFCVGTRFGCWTAPGHCRACEGKTRDRDDIG